MSSPYSPPVLTIGNIDDDDTFEDDIERIDEDLSNLWKKFETIKIARRELIKAQRAKIRKIEYEDNKRKRKLEKENNKQIKSVLKEKYKKESKEEKEEPNDEIDSSEEGLLD
jgi:hypothetical protein